MRGRRGGEEGEDITRSKGEEREGLEIVKMRRKG